MYPESGGTWYGADKIETSSGRAYDFINPDPADIKLDDIAYSLSNINRFGGHARPFWSVAQHSCFVVEILEAQGWGFGTVLRAALLHDAPEAFLGDVPRPAKPHYGQPYRDLTVTAEQAIAARFRLNPEWFHSPTIKQADHLALVNEGHYVMTIGPPAEELLPLPGELKMPEAWSNDYAYVRYLRKAAILGLK